MDKKELRSAYKERKIMGGICAIKNNENGKMLLSQTADLKGFFNRFEFSKSTGGCIHTKLSKDWIKFGANAFSFEVLEELEKKETQTSKEFNNDLETLKEIWIEKMDPESLY